MTLQEFDAQLALGSIVCIVVPSLNFKYVKGETYITYQVDVISYSTRKPLFMVPISRGEDLIKLSRNSFHAITIVRDYLIELQSRIGQ